MTVRVLLADDERLVRVGLRGILTADPEIEVGAEAGDGVEAVTRARETRPDVALVDVRMPRMDGIEATRRLRALADPPAVVVLTSFDVDQHVYDALCAGACGFLLKDAPEARLLAVVRSAREGVALFDPRVTLRLVERLRPAVPHRHPSLDALTPRERMLLAELASGAGNAQIGRRLGISEATVKTHVSSILAKLGLASRAQAAVVAYEAGLIPPTR